MKLPLGSFYRTLPLLAASPPTAGSAKGSAPPQAPLAGVAGDRVELSPALETSPSESWVRLARETTRQLAASMNPGALLQAAMLAALQVTDETTERWDADTLLQSVQDERPVTDSPELSAIYARMQPHLQRALPQPLLSEDPLLGEGAQAGPQVLLNPRRLQDPNLATFVLAHELAHAEGRHTVRQAALREAAQWFPHEEGRSALQEAQWNLEREADARAVELSVQAGLRDPRPILETLLQSPQGDEHPNGVERATAVRDGFRDRGVEISAQDWQLLFDRTQAVRDAHQLAQQKELAFRRALASFV